jgi:Protein of unknown function (DUF1501)
MFKRCKGTSRRDFLRVGVLGGFGVGLADLLRLEAQGASSSRQKNAIFIYLNGGQSHLESWDPKPDGGDVAGEFRPVRTSLPGLSICEHMPKLARQADRYTVIRGIKDAIGAHRLAQLLMRTGNRALPSLAYPDVGSIIAREHQAPAGVPSYVSLPISASNGSSESAGYLGVAYSPFRVNEDPNAANFNIRALSTPTGMTFRRVESRMSLLQQLDTAYRDIDRDNANIKGRDQFYQQAADILRSSKTRKAFALDDEPVQVRQRYGRTSLGQACLLARRLIEVGVRCVTIDFGGWDTHRNNFTTLKDRLLPPWDAALAALLSDLHQRGLLADTLVWSTGEMGRTPKINKNAGRDHWGRAMSMVLAGGGIKGGFVLGKTDRTGSEVIEDGCKPEDVAASVLHALGINPRKEYHTSTGRPIMLVRDGNVVQSLFA